MRILTIAVAVLRLSSATSGRLYAQDGAAVEARYDAAIAWVRLVVVEHDFERAATQANEAVAARMTADVLEQAWDQLGPQLGALVSLEPREQSMEQGFNMVVLTGVFAAGHVRHTGVHGR
jgi:hypothetical protein